MAVCFLPATADGSAAAWKQGQAEAREANLGVGNIYYSSAVISGLARADESNPESILQRVKESTEENQ